MNLHGCALPHCAPPSCGDSARSSCATLATDGSLQRMVRQEGVTVRCRRFRGTFLEVVGTAVGGVSLAHSQHTDFPSRGPRRCVTITHCSPAMTQPPKGARP